MAQTSFEPMLSGGHPNSLGRIEVVEIVLSDRSQLEQLYEVRGSPVCLRRGLSDNCYFSEDEVVRLRTSNAMKRICQAKTQWLVPYSALNNL